MSSVKIHLKLLIILLLSQILFLSCSSPKKINSVELKEPGYINTNGMDFINANNNIKDSEYFNNMGLEFSNANNIESAYDAFEMAIKSNPKNHIAWYNKALVLERWGKYDKALIAINESLKINPDSYLGAWNTKATILNHSNKKLLALDAINQALVVNKYSAEALYNKGVILYELNWFDQSLLAYEKTVEINPRHSGAWYNRGTILY